MKTVDHRLRDLLHATKGLKASDTDRSRKFWRKKFARALRALKAQADQDYPGPKVKRERSRASDATRARRLREAGWRPVSEVFPSMSMINIFAASCAIAGVRLRLISNVTWAPEWALKIGCNEAKLRAARLDRQQRKLIVRKIELTKEAEESGVPEKAIPGVVRTALELDKLEVR